MELAFVYGASHIVEGSMAYFLYENIFGRHIRKHAIVIYVMAYTILFGLMFLHNPNLNLGAYIIVNCFLINFLYSTTINQGLFYSFLIAIIMLITEIIPELLVHSFSYIRYSNITYNSQVLLCFIASKTFFALFILSLAHFKKKKGTPQSGKPPVYLIATISCCVAILTILYFVTLMTPLSGIAEDFLLAGCVLIIILILLILWLQDFIQKKEEELSKTELILQQEKNATRYFETVEEQEKNRNIIIHDIKNHILVVKELCKEGKISEIEKYLDQLISLPSLSKNVKLTTDLNMNIILNVYVSRCEQLHIKFNVDRDTEYRNFMDISHLTSLFCNLLDNSVEAAKSCDNPFISVILRYDKRMDCAKISITNSCIK